jgi:hypothetical protein
VTAGRSLLAADALARTIRALLVACTVALTLVLPASPATAGSDPGDRDPAVGTEADPTIRLIRQDGVVDPDDEFVAFFEVSGVPAGSDLAVDIYPAITTPAQLEAALAGTPRNSIGTFPVIDLPGDPARAPVQTGFVINLWGGNGPAKAGGWAKRLTRAGVYPVKVRLRGPDNTTVETLVTYLLRGPDTDETLEPAPLALLADVRSGTPAADLLADPTAPLPEAVLRSIATLTELLTVHRDVPVTLAVAPEVARRLAGGGTAPGPGPTSSTTSSTTAPSTSGPEAGGDPASDDADPPVRPTAATVLAGLVDLVEPADRELLGAPAHDIDPAELIALDLGDELRAQQADGVRILSTLLEPPVTTLLRATTRLDAPAIEALDALGVTDLLADPAVVQRGDATLPARVAATPAPARITVVDPALRTGGHPDPVLAAHQLVGHLAARAAIGDASPLVVTVDLPRADPADPADPAESPTANDATEVDALLGLLTDNPFLAPRTTSDLLRATDTAPEQVTLTAPPAATDRAWAADLRRTRSLLASYTSMVPDQPELVGGLGDRLANTTDRRLGAADRGEHVAAVRADLEARFTAVSIPSSDRVTLGARDAQFPLVLTSESEVPVRVVVELSASDRLTIKEPRIEVVLENDHTEVPIEVRSRLPGDTPLRIRVTSPDGAVLLSEGTYSVRSTAVSGVGLVLTVGAGLFLAGWWGRHIVRSRRHRGRHAR